MLFFWKLVAKYRLKHNKEDEERINEKFGISSDFALKKLQDYKQICIKNNTKSKIIWLNAVSIGESLSVISFVEELVKKDYFVLFTTTTLTSTKIITKKIEENELFKHNVVHQFFPYPCLSFFKKIYQTWQPEKVFFVESEIYPSVVKYLAKKADIYLLNARMSNHSFNFWKKVRFYIKPVLTRYKTIFASSEIEAEKFKYLSKNQANIKCFGNLKIENTYKTAQKVINDKTSNISAKCELLKKAVEGEIVITYGSPHKSEFYYLVWQHCQLMKKISQNNLAGCFGIFVPRYLEEVGELVKLFQQNDIEPTLWSDYCGGDLSSVLIINELGCLNYFYNLSDYSVVCGNFAPEIGGHNPIEPIAFSKPTLIGKYCNKCQDLVDDLLKHNAVIQTETLCDDISLLTKNENNREILIKNGQKYLEENNTTLEKILEELKL